MVKNNSLADFSDEVLARYLVIAYEGIEGVLTHLLAISLVNSILADLTYKHIARRLGEGDSHTLECLRQEVSMLLPEV